MKIMAEIKNETMLKDEELRLKISHQLFAMIGRDKTDLWIKVTHKNEELKKKCKEQKEDGVLKRYLYTVQAKVIDNKVIITEYKK